MARKRSFRDLSGPVSRRDALRHITTLGLGAAAIGAGCSPGPDRCEAGPEAPPVGADYDDDGSPTARRLLDQIDTFVVLFLENRSFDHLFGSLGLDQGYPARATVDGLRGDEMNLDAEGGPILVHPTPGILTTGPLHDWDSAHKTFAEGLNDAFVLTNAGPFQADPMAYHDRSQLPVHYALADQFTVCDRWFSSVMGPTWPNRFFMHAATSEGLKTNKPITDRPPTIWSKLGKGCWSSKAYTAGPIHWYYAGFGGKPLGGNDPMVAARIENFFDDARNGELPSFSLIDPDFWSSDMHPPHSLALGEALIASVVRAMQESPQWKRSLLVITYDEHGGFFDHVAPPTTADPRPDFRQLGFRVPALVVGPTVRRGQVVSSTFEHVSVAATLRTRFGIESLGERMDATADLSPCIDPDLVGLPSGPVGALPKTELDGRRLAQARFRTTSQPWIDHAIRAGSIPTHLIDPRSAEERVQSLLRRAQELDVVRVRG